MQGPVSPRVHGDLEQHERDRVMRSSQREHAALGRHRVAARGIDIATSTWSSTTTSAAARGVRAPDRSTGRAGKEGSHLVRGGARQAQGEDIEHTRGEARARRWRPRRRDEPAASRGGRGRARSAGRLERAARGHPAHRGGPQAKDATRDILGALTGEAGRLAGSDIGKIEIHDNFSYVAVNKSVSRQAQQASATTHQGSGSWSR